MENFMSFYLICIHYSEKKKSLWKDELAINSNSTNYIRLKEDLLKESQQFLGNHRSS